MSQSASSSVARIYPVLLKNALTELNITPLFFAFHMFYDTMTILTLTYHNLFYLEAKTLQTQINNPRKIGRVQKLPPGP